MHIIGHLNINRSPTPVSQDHCDVFLSFSPHFFLPFLYSYPSSWQSTRPSVWVEERRQKERSGSIHSSAGLTGTVWRDWRSSHPSYPELSVEQMDYRLSLSFFLSCHSLISSPSSFFLSVSVSPRTLLGNWSCHFLPSVSSLSDSHAFPHFPTCFLSLSQPSALCWPF